MKVRSLNLKKMAPTLLQGRRLSVRPRVPAWLAREAGRKGVRVCPRCQAIYYDKHWHTWSNVSTRLPAAAVATGDYCPSCRAAVVEKGSTGRYGYAGELILEGLKEGRKKSEMLALVRNAGKRALRRDPEDQIVKIEDRGSSVRITTAENQLAVSISKQIDSASKGGRLKISWSREDRPVRVTWRAGK